MTFYIDRLLTAQRTRSWARACQSWRYESNLLPRVDFGYSKRARCYCWLLMVGAVFKQQAYAAQTQQARYAPYGQATMAYGQPGQTYGAFTPQQTGQIEVRVALCRVVASTFELFRFA